MTQTYDDLPKGLLVPVPLHEADLAAPEGWIYDSEVGVYICASMVCHELALAHLEWVKQGRSEEWRSCFESEIRSEDFLKRSGVCFMSSVSSSIQVWNRDILDSTTVRFFRKKGFMFSYLD